ARHIASPRRKVRRGGDRRPHVGRLGRDAGGHGCYMVTRKHHADQRDKRDQGDQRAGDNDDPFHGYEWKVWTRTPSAVSAAAPYYVTAATRGRLCRVGQGRATRLGGRPAVGGRASAPRGLARAPSSPRKCARPLPSAGAELSVGPEGPRCWVSMR